MKRIAFINHKGGCGKTTSLFHIAGELSYRGFKVLVVDTDKQLDTSMAFLSEEESGYDDRKDFTILDLINGKSFEDVVKKNYIKVGNKKPAYKNIDVIPADRNLVNQDYVRNITRERGKHIKEVFYNLNYDYVLIDCPPSNSAVEDLVLQNIATDVITPMSCDSNAIRGYGELLRLINKSREKNPDLKMLGTFLSMYSDFNFNPRPHGEGDEFEFPLAQ